MELVTWVQLTTMTAISTLTFLIVSNTKDLPGIRSFRTFLWTVFIATTLLCVANIAVGADYLDWRLYTLCFFNGWFVAAVTGKMSDDNKKKVE